MRTMTPAQIAEIELLRAESGGVLLPERLLEFAHSANTALHTAFDWEDGEAAVLWRLHQARQAIRAVVTMLPSPSGAMVPVRAYAFDVRRRAYVATAEVLGDDEGADLLLRQMRLDVERVTSRYRRHASLVPHIDAALSALRLQAAE